MLQPGEIIQQKYQVIRLIGQGGMSNIYLCRHRTLNNRFWAVKEFTARYQDQNEQQIALRHFEREAQLLSGLKHPSLPTVDDYFFEGGKYYLVMEYIEGEDLGKLLERIKGPLPELQVAEWAEQTASVLYYLHCHKPEPIIFRDVKPSNIIICNGKIKLIDFGIARLFNPKKGNDTMRIGSPGYAPPEQYSGQTDARSDIFALGITIHQCLTGYDPTTSQTPFAIPAVQSLNPSVSEQMATVVAKATKIVPEERYQTMIELKRDVRAFIVSRRGATQPGIGGGGVAPATNGAATPPNAPAAPAAPPNPATAANYTTPNPATAANNPTSPTAATATATSGSGKHAGNASTSGKKKMPVLSANAAPTANVRKAGCSASRSLALVFIIFCLLAGAAIYFYPHRCLNAARSAYAWAIQPRESAENAALESFKNGANADYCLDAVNKDLTQYGDRADLVLCRNNCMALVTSSIPPIEVGVLCPQENAEQILHGAAQAQQYLNVHGGVALPKTADADSKRAPNTVIVYGETYVPGAFSQSVEKLFANARPVAGRPRVDRFAAVLVWGDSLADEDVELLTQRCGKSPVYRVGSVGSELSITGPLGSHSKQLTLSKKPLVATLAARGLQSATIVTPDAAVAQTLQASKLKVSRHTADELVQDAALNRATTVFLVNAPGLDLDTLRSVRARVVVLASRSDDLPELSHVAATGAPMEGWVQLSSFHPTGAGINLYLRSLHPASFAATEDNSASENSPSPLSISAYDTLLWTATSALGRAPFLGVQAESDSGTLSPIPWQVYQAQERNWHYIGPVNHTLSDHPQQAHSTTAKDKDN